MEQDEKEKPSKEEYAVGKFLKFHQSLNKDGKFLGNNTHYFVGMYATTEIVFCISYACKCDFILVFDFLMFYCHFVKI
jgi:hypothetical protein